MPPTARHVLFETKSAIVLSSALRGCPDSARLNAARQFGVRRCPWLASRTKRFGDPAHVWFAAARYNISDPELSIERGRDDDGVQASCLRGPLRLGSSPG